MADNKADHSDDANNNKTINPVMSIIPNALKYYDENTAKYIGIRKKIKYWIKSADGVEFPYSDSPEENEKFIKIRKNSNHMIHTFYDKDKKVLFSSRIEFVGWHYTAHNIWVWAWGVPVTNKAECTTIRNVFLYATDLNAFNAGELDYETSVLKNELTTSRSLVTNQIQVDIRCALSSYLSKNPLIVPYYAQKKDPSTPFVTYLDTGGEGPPPNAYEIIYYTFLLDPPDV